MKSAFVVLFVAICGYLYSETAAKSERLVVISEVYNEIIWALGAQDSVVGVDLSSTYPPEVKKVQNVGYHRALSAEGILSLHPTAVLHDNNIGPPQVVQQLESLSMPMKTFTAQNNSVDGDKALIREMGDYFHKEKRAEELCKTIDSQMAASLEEVKKYKDHPRVAVIHYGRASNVYLIVGKGKGTGDGSAASQIIEWAGGLMAIDAEGMQRMASPEIIAQANPDVILITDYGYDKLGSMDQIKALPGVETSNAAKTNRIFRVESDVLMRFGPRTGENIRKVAEIIHGK
ncbi:MAG TPA: ABC transporter substrate-binding protein [Acidobacteriota bacterium]